MGWVVEYWDGTNWVAVSHAIVKQIVQELNGHEEASFILSNSSSNRTFVSSDQRVRFSFNGTVIFTGKLYGATLKRDRIECIVYNECYEIMKSKVHTGTYSTTAANTILSNICSSAGVVAGSCPTTAVSVRFDNATCYDAAVFLAKTLGKDFWSDYDANGNPRFNIGDRTNSSPYPTFTPLEIPERTVDRAKKRDKVIVRGVDANGNPISATAGTGTNVAVFTERKATDTATLQSIANAKLAELNKEHAGVKLPAKITAVYNLQPGYYVTLTIPELGITTATNYRIWKITKKLEEADVEIDKYEAILERYMQSLDELADLGIYPVSSDQLYIPQDYEFVIRKNQGQYVVYDSNGAKKYSAAKLNGAFNWITANYTPKGIKIYGSSDYYEIDGALTFISNLTVYAAGVKIKAVAAMTQMLDLRNSLKVKLQGDWFLDGNNYASYCVDVGRSVSASTEITIEGHVVCQGYVQAGLRLIGAEDFCITGKVDCYGWLTEGGACNGNYGVQIGDPSTAIYTMGIIHLDNVTSSRNKLADIFIKDVFVCEMRNVLCTTKGDWTGAENFIANIVISGWQYGCDVKIVGGWIEGKNKPQIKIINAKSRRLELVNPHIVNEGTAGSAIYSAVAANNLVSFRCEGGLIQVNNGIYHVEIAPDDFYLEGTEMTCGDGSGWANAISKSNWTNTRYFIRPKGASSWESNEIPYIQNFSFELPEKQELDAIGWEKITYSGSVSFSRVTDAVDGMYSYKITNAGSTSRGAIVSQKFPIAGNRPYLFSCYAKTSNASYRARLILHTYNSAGTEVGGPYEVYTYSTSWVRISKVIVTDATAVAGKFELATDQAAYSAYFDYVRIAERSNEGSQFPQNPEIGDIFFHTSYQQTFRYDPNSSAPNVDGWVPLTRIVHKGTTSQRLSASVVTGDFWWDTDQNAMYQWDGSTWVFMGTSTAIKEGTEPAENMIRNAGFETDFNNDGVPDYWEKYVAAGSGSIGLSTDSKFGKNSIKVTADTGSSNIAALSSAFPVDPDRTYYWEVWSKPQYSNNGDVTVWLYGYDRTGAYIGAKKVVDNQNRSNSSWTKDCGTVTPSADADFGTSRANIRYMKIGLYCDTPTTAPAYILFDEVKFSEMRAAVPTAGVVAGILGYGTQSLTIPAGSGGNPGQTTSSTFTVPSTEHEMYVVWIWIARRYETSGDEAVGTRLVEIRLYDVTDNISYPGGLNYCPTVDLREPAAGVGTACGPGVFIPFLIPKNIAGHTLCFYLYNWTQGSDCKVFIRRGGYGFSPHYHR